MADNMKLHPVDLVGIGNLLEYAVAEKSITCEQRDRIIKRIADENGFEDYTLPVLAGYKRSKDEVMERAAHREATVSQCKNRDESYISLTEVARAHTDDAPGYVIQIWLRSGNTLGNH